MDLLLVVLISTMIDVWKCSLLPTSLPVVQSYPTASYPTSPFQSTLPTRTHHDDRLSELGKANPHTIAVSHLALVSPGQHVLRVGGALGTRLDRPLCLQYDLRPDRPAPGSGGPQQHPRLHRRNPVELMQWTSQLAVIYTYLMQHNSTRLTDSYRTLGCRDLRTLRLTTTSTTT